MAATLPGSPAECVCRAGRGRSSVGRAPQSHCGGQGFKSPRLHQGNHRFSFGLAAQLSFTKTAKRQSGTTLAQRVMDMASIRKRGRSWHAQVRRQGLPAVTRSFSRRSDAELWARQRETEIDRGDLPVNSRELRSHTLRQLLERYRDTVTPLKRGADQERYKLRVLLADPMADLSLDRLKAGEIAKYRDDRLVVVKGDTVRRELALVRHCLELARREWGIPVVVNPVRQIKLPPVGLSRERRATVEELSKLAAACGHTRTPWVRTMIQMAIETGMRRSELLSITWANVD